MSSTPQIRLAVARDAPCIATMSRELIEQGLPWSWRPARVAQAIAAADTNVAVVGGPAQLVAFGIMEHADDDAHLLLFAVRASCQRQGLGSALLRWLEASALAAGARRIRLEARIANSAARCFYNEHGYHERVLVPGLYRGAVDGVRLEKWLLVDQASAARP